MRPERHATLSAPRTKQAIGKLEVDGDIVTASRETGFSDLPVEFEHSAAVARLPLHHRDPFDRLLIAQAGCEGLTVVTRDDAFGAYDVEVLPA